MKACQDSHWSHDTGTRHRSETKRVAERAVRRVKEGTSYRTSAKWTTRRMVGLRNAIVTCATLTTKWPMAGQHWRKAVAKKLTDQLIPFGSLVEYNPIAAKDKSRVRQCGKKTFQGKFFGFVLRVGGGWSGYLMAADHEDLQGSETTDI